MEIPNENVETQGDTPFENTDQPKLNRLRKLLHANMAVSVFLVLLLGLGAIFAWGPITQYRNTDPKFDGYVQPRSIATLVELVQE